MGKIGKAVRLAKRAMSSAEVAKARRGVESIARPEAGRAYSKNAQEAARILKKLNPKEYSQVKAYLEKFAPLQKTSDAAWIRKFAMTGTPGVKGKGSAFNSTANRAYARASHKLEQTSGNLGMNSSRFGRDILSQLKSLAERGLLPAGAVAAASGRKKESK